jgi:predicted XRE-type DNA-binding protein
LTKKQLNNLVKRSGLKQNFIAKQLGISYVHLSYIINGKRNPIKTKKRIINFLNNFRNVA